MLKYSKTMSVVAIHTAEEVESRDITASGTSDPAQRTAPIKSGLFTRFRVWYDSLETATILPYISPFKLAISKI